MNGMDRVIAIARWIAVVPAALVGWWLALLIGIFLLGIAEGFCPEDLALSGSCTAAWFPAVGRAITIVAVAAAAMLVVLLPVIVAPNRKWRVAITAFLIGSSAAIYMAISTAGWWELVSALAAGGVTLFKIGRYHAVP